MKLTSSLMKVGFHLFLLIMEQFPICRKNSTRPISGQNGGKTGMGQMKGVRYLCQRMNKDRGLISKPMELFSLRWPRRADIGFMPMFDRTERLWREHTKYPSSFQPPRQIQKMNLSMSELFQ